MTRDEMLNEHLQVIYFLNELDLTKIKAKAKQISTIANTGNILRLKQVFDTIPDTSLEGLTSVARKKFPSDYKKSEKEINVKLKKAPENIKNIMTLAKTSLMQIKSQSKDPEIQEKTTEALENFNKTLEDITRQITVEGASLIGFGLIISMLIGATAFIGPVMLGSGLVFIAVAIIMFITKVSIDIYINAKKTGKRKVS